MTYDQYKNRIAANMNRDDLGTFIADWINEAREEISLHQPFNFLLTSKSIALVGGTFNYEFDKAESTGRYGGIHYSVVFNNATTKIKLNYLESKMFDRLFPNPGTADPTAYTVRGSQFIVNNMPSSVAGKTFEVKFYAFPDLLSAGSDEKYMDKKYYNTVIASVCVKASIHIQKVDLAGMWTEVYKNELTKMIAQDTGVRLSDVQLRDGATEIGGAGVGSPSTGG